MVLLIYLPEFSVINERNAVKMKAYVAGTAATMQHRLYMPLIVTMAFLVHTIQADILVMIRGSNQVGNSDDNPFVQKTHEKFKTRPNILQFF